MDVLTSKMVVKLLLDTCYSVHGWNHTPKPWSGVRTVWTLVMGLNPVNQPHATFLRLKQSVGVYFLQMKVRATTKIVGEGTFVKSQDLKCKKNRVRKKTQISQKHEREVRQLVNEFYPREYSNSPFFGRRLIILINPMGRGRRALRGHQNPGTVGTGLAVGPG